MSKATTREAQHGFGKLLAKVERGETVVITRRGVVVAELSRVSKNKPEWPDFAARLKRIFGSVPRGKPASQVVIEDREERL